MVTDAAFIAMGMGARVNAVARERDQVIDTAVDVLKNLNDVTAVARERRQRIEQLEAQLRETQLCLMVEQMHTAGLEAQRAHLKHLGANSPTAFEPSGKKYADGDSKSRLRVVYEAAFDAKGRQLGIANPAAHRAD